MSHRTLFLVDGHALAYRAFYAIPNLTSPEGKPTGAVLGFFRKVLKVVRDRKPDALAVIFDPHGPTHRDELSADYKATRSPMPDPLREQLGWIVDLVPAIGLRMLQVDGFEADDVIATLTERAAQEGWAVEILSGDKDLAALVTDTVTLLAPSREIDAEKRLDPAGVREKFGVPPEAIPDLLSLMGDASDNIPGLPGVGEKTAAKLIQEHGSVDGVIAARDMLPPRVRKAISEHRGDLDLSRALVRLRRDVPLESLSFPGDFPARLAPTQEALERFRSLGFRSIVAELKAEASGEPVDPAAAGAGGDVGPPVASRRRKKIADPTLFPDEEESGGEASTAASSITLPPHVILDAKTLPAYLERLSAAPIAAVDTETTALLPRAAKLVGISFAAPGIEPAWLPVWSGEGPDRDLLAVARRWLEDPAAAKCLHHAKYDIQVLRGAGIELQGVAFDSLVADGVLAPERRSHGMDQLARDLFQHESISFEEVAPGGDFRAVPTEDAARYACEDAWLTLAFHEALFPELERRGLRGVYEEIEHPLVTVLADIEWTGFRVDAGRLAVIAEEFRADLVRLKSEALAAACREFNPDSPKQVGVVLFEDLALPAMKKTKTGWSTDQETLEELRGLHPLPGILLEYREVAKLLNTYVEALPGLILPSTGRIHASFRQVGAATGRLSCVSPNLQNIPIRTDRGRRIRGAFVAEPGKRLVAADYSQVEFRIAAWLAGEESLLEAFRSGRDLHAATAERLFGMDQNAGNAEKAEARRRAKAVNFGILYGQSGFGLARQLGIPRRDADRLIAEYFAAFPAIKAWIDRTIREARERGEATTLFGRRRALPELNASNRNVRAGAERVAVNTPVQGAAADVIKIAMARVAEKLTPGSGRAMVLQVHDELMIEAPEGDAEAVEALLRDAMKEVPILGGILDVNTGSGRDWLEASH